MNVNKVFSNATTLICLACGQAQAVLGVTVDPVSLGFGDPMSYNTVRVATTPIAVTNSGTENATYSFLVNTATPGTIWSVGTSTTPKETNKFVLFGAIHCLVTCALCPTQPALNDFEPEDAVTTADQVCTNSKYATDGTFTGVNVPASEARCLWLRLDMPLMGGTTDTQALTLTITANTP